MSNHSVQNISAATNENLIQNTTQKTTKSKSSDFSKYLDHATSSETDLESIFKRAAKKYGVDVNLLKAIAKKESEFNPKVTSHSGAMGIMQLMPATAKAMGVKDAYDPEQNIMGGAKLISKLLKQYNGNVTLALAAYNAGSGNVKKYGGVPPFKETQNYVVKVQEFYKNGVTIPSSKQKVKTAGEANIDDKDISSSEPATAKTINFENAAVVNVNPMLEASLEAIQAQDQLLDSLQKMLTSFGEHKDNDYSYEDYARFIKTYLDQISVSEIGKAKEEDDDSLANAPALERVVVDTSLPEVAPSTHIDSVTLATEALAYNPSLIDMILRRS